jgi:hypothetical protein
MTESNWWEVGGYTILVLWLCRVAWIVFDIDMEDSE